MDTEEPTELLFSNIDRLPLEVVNIIWEYVPASRRVWLNRKGMGEHYVAVFFRWGAEPVRAVLSQSGVRRLLRNDRVYPFRLVIAEMYQRWARLKRWQYKMWTFPTYISCLYHLCAEYGSNNCRGALVAYERGLGVYAKNRSKKTKVRLNRWSS